MSNINSNTQQILKKMARNSYLKYGKVQSNEINEQNIFDDEKGSFKEFFDHSFFNTVNKNNDHDIYSDVDYADVYCPLNDRSEVYNNKHDLTQEEIYQADDFMSSVINVILSILTYKFLSMLEEGR